MKRVLLEPVGRMHSYLQKLVDYPPEGYEIVISDGPWDKVVRLDITSQLSRILGRFIPAYLVKSYLDRFLKRLPNDIDLIYAYGHLVTRKHPWVVEAEQLAQLAGYYNTHLRRYRSFIERALSSAYCKRIICWTQFTANQYYSNLDCQGFAHKMEIVPNAVPAKQFRKAYNEDKVRLLFMGTSNLPGQFDVKGGREVLEAFSILSQRYDNLELTVRSDVPPDVREEYLGLKGLTIIESIVPGQVLEELYKSADILIQPNHNTPLMAFLEAFSYEVPVVATELYGTPEMVVDGETGFLVAPSDQRPYYVADYLPPGFENVLRYFGRLDKKVAQRLVEKIAILIESPELRRKMGRAARWEIEHGRFSMAGRDAKLKRIFDEATSA